jgi:tRNA-splicing ligase RtcB
VNVIKPKDGAPIKMWTDGVPVEWQAEQQLRNIATLPFIYKHIAVMPDVHLGKGATVGSVIATRGAIIPAAVGVDIGCGMMAVRTGYTASDLPDDLGALRHSIERGVPVGNGPGGNHREVPSAVSSRLRAGLYDRFLKIKEKHKKITGEKIDHQLGTMGGGNHFLEVCLDEEQRVWVMLHSGSRGIGNKIGSYFIEKAKEDMRVHFINLPDKDLAYLAEGTEHFNDYVEAVGWAQDYARINRELMMGEALKTLSFALLKKSFVTDTAVSCHHNYIQKENHFGANVWVTRKGAVSARQGQYGIIPGSMGTRSYIVEGKGNPESFTSCSHGAGRRMSRTEAKKTFTLEDHIKAVEGVECRRDADVIDETPGAYKDIDAVMAAQTDLVSVKHELRAVLCIKG